MNIADLAPFTVLLNSGVDERRRNDSLCQLRDLGLSYERNPLFDHEEPCSEEVERKASAGIDVAVQKRRLAKCSAIRGILKRALAEQMESFLLIDDDVVFHPCFIRLATLIDLPHDWGVVSLGGSHKVRPTWQSARLVRVVSMIDSPAVVIRRTYYEHTLKLLESELAKPWDEINSFEEIILSSDRNIPIYACYPNLTWRDKEKSQSEQELLYSSDGLQLILPDGIRGLLGEAVGVKWEQPKRIKLALLFLTRGDVIHKALWREFAAQSPSDIAIFAHPKQPEMVKGGFLEPYVIDNLVPTRWGDISLVRATRNMLTEALEDIDITHFALLSESCIPVKPLREILRHLHHDPRSQISYHNFERVPTKEKWRAIAVPQISLGAWRFHSQWWLMNREAAIFSTAEDYTEIFANMFAPDEAYFGTILALQGFPLDGQVVNRSPTWLHWQNEVGRPKEWNSMNDELRNRIVSSGAFFARKFLASYLHKDNLSHEFK